MPPDAGRACCAASGSHRSGTSWGTYDVLLLSDEVGFVKTFAGIFIPTLNTPFALLACEQVEQEV